jgi:threonine dehydratase
MPVVLAQRPDLQSIRDAVERIRNVIVVTPLVPLRPDPDGAPILLKPEIHQAVGSFKIRGVFNAVASMTDEERRRGISTFSAGNTAQAVAWSARYFGVPARSLMPDSAPKTKIDAVRAYGATPVLVPIDDLFDYIRNHGWESEQYSFVHPWTDQRVLTGHAGMAIELLEARPDIDTVYIPVGGGGLIGGVGSALKLLNPAVRVIGVEPEECCALHASFEAGHAVAAACQTISDGVAVPYLAAEMFPLLREVVDDVVLVSEDATRSAIRQLALYNKMIVEGAGALATAAALNAPASERGISVAIVTGGGIDLDRFLTIIQQ